MLFKKKKSAMLFAMLLTAICTEVLAQTNEPESSAGMVPPPKLIHKIDISPHNKPTVLGTPLRNRPDSISWSPDGTRMAVQLGPVMGMAVELNAAVQIFDMTHPATPKLLYTLNHGKIGSISEVHAVYNDDGSQLWVGVRDRWSHDLNYTVCDGIHPAPAFFQKSYTIVPSSDLIDEFAFSRNRKQLAVARSNALIEVYEMTYPKPLQPLFDKRDAINPPLFNRLVSWLLLLTPITQNLNWLLLLTPITQDLPPHGTSNASSQTVYSTSLLHTLHHEREWGTVKDVVFNNDGSRLAVGYSSGYVVIFDTSARSEKETSCATLNREKWWTKKNSFTKKHSSLPLHALIATSQIDLELLCEPERNHQVWKLAYNHDGSRLAVLDVNGTVNIYDGMNPVSSLYTLDGGWSIAFNHDGSLLAVGGYDRISIYQLGADNTGSQPASD